MPGRQPAPTRQPSNVTAVLCCAVCGPSQPPEGQQITMAAAPVGFIGLGIMGVGMARNLLRSGRSLVVWNRSRDKAEALAAEVEATAGSSSSTATVTVAATPADVVEGCTLTYSMLSTLEASADVFPQVLPKVGGKMLVDCATLTPQRMAEMAAAVTATGGQFLEAPVSGSKGPAESGQLIFIAAGAEAVRAAAQEDLEAMGKATFFLGEEVGSGSRMKLVVNMSACCTLHVPLLYRTLRVPLPLLHAVMGVQLNAVAEGVALTEAAGLPVEELLKILDLGVMSSGLVRGKGAAMHKRSYEPQFPRVLDTALDMPPRHLVLDPNMCAPWCTSVFMVVRGGLFADRSQARAERFALRPRAGGRAGAGAARGVSVERAVQKSAQIAWRPRLFGRGGIQPRELDLTTPCVFEYQLPCYSAAVSLVIRLTPLPRPGLPRRRQTAHHARA